MSSPRVVFASTLAAMLLGCGAGEEPMPAVDRAMVDGVEIVTSQRPSWDEGKGWRLAAEPEVVIGEESDDPRYLFSIVRGPVRLPDGVIVAGDYRSREVRFFDASGELIRIVGGAGEGPGELAGLNAVMHCGPDTIYVLDRGREEINVFDFSGRFIERHPYEENAGISVYALLRCNGEGQLLAMDWGNMFEGRPPEDGHYRTRVHLWLLDPQGFVLQDFGEFPGVDQMLYSRGRSRGGGPHPLGKTPARALGDERAYIGTADEFEIEVWSLDGELLRRIRRPIEDQAITGAQIERYQELVERRADGEPTPPFRIDAENTPPTFPAYGRFLLDATDHLWVEHYRRPWEDGPRAWSVFDPEGIWLGDVEVPPTFEIRQIGNDHVLGVFRDELDQESVRSYRLHKDTESWS